MVEVALKYGAPIRVPDSIPPENVEVPEALIAMASVVVGARRPAELISHDLPKSDDGSK